MQRFLMAKFYDALDDKLTDFINKQHIFFTTTAPEEGRINLSPKGMDTFTCLNSTQVAYLNLTGSGNETAHSPPSPPMHFEQQHFHFAPEEHAQPSYCEKYCLYK